MRSLLSSFVALGAFAALALGAGPARADVCGDVYDECELADAVVGWNLDAVESHLPLPSGVCQKSADGVLKQCQAAVKAAAKCWKGQYGAVPKTAKPACKTEGSAASECNASFEERYSSETDELDDYVSFELDCCEDRVDEYYETCVTGLL